MEQKLTISDIAYIRNLADNKTDEELAVMIGKPVVLVQMQFSLMADLPKRPWEKGPVVKLPKPPKKKKVSSKLVKSVKKKSSKKEKAVKNRTKTGSQRDKQKKKAVKKRKVVKVQEEVLNRQKEWKGKNDKAQFKTRQLDLTGTIPIKLNAKTTVWVKPGTDIEKLKKKYNIA